MLILQSLSRDKARLETEHSKLQVEHDRVKSEVEKKAMAASTVKAAVLQMQGLQQTMLNVLD